MSIDPSRLGEQELQILRHIARHPSSTAGEVAEHFARARSVARTTVVTMMERLRRKRHLVREKVGGVYRYSSRMPESALLQSLMHDFTERVLGGSLEPFVSFLVGRAKLSDRQVQDLTQIIRDIEAAGEEKKP
jgi:predicted transcriptional regulator